MGAIVVGPCVGAGVLGLRVEASVGLWVGAWVGLWVGAWVGLRVGGRWVGARVGRSVGAGVSGLKVDGRGVCPVALSILMSIQLTKFS